MITGDLQFGMPWEAFRLSTIIPAMGKKLIKEQGIDDGIPLKAYVNRGRWAIKCECGGAEYAFEAGIFMCRSCWNSRHGHRYRRFTFPRSRKRIERLLIIRPLENRNWFSDEPVSHLEAENIEHKAELLEVY